jgi:tRNA dimethylallyltransferase
MTPRIWLIGGPTASGKSGLALRLAQAVDGEIVGADSMQIYADLPILTAAPTAQEQATVRHHLVGVADASETWSVGRWLRAASDVLKSIAGRGHDAVIVGGTGLYFKALTRGLADVPPISKSQRDASLALYDEIGEPLFRDAVAALDPAAADRIGIGDRQRLTRAHAVAAATGRALTDWQTVGHPSLTDYSAVALAPPREDLYARCDARLDRMVEEGALEEVAALSRRGLDPALPALKAVGYRELAAHVAGEMTLEAALAEAAMQTRRYAKRQSTWFRNQTPDWPAIEDLEPEAQWRSFLALNPALTAQA